MVSSKTCGIGCGIGCCGCLLICPWTALVLLSLVSLGSHPSFCDSGLAPEVAAAKTRPDVYQEDGSIVWESVSTGWNTACGKIPDNFSAAAEIYKAETGGRALLVDDSGFKSNAWSAGNYRVFSVKDMAEVASFPFGSRAQSIQTMAKTFQVNLFFMPTATAEVAGWMNLQYEVCAYFQGTSDSPPDMRLYKTTQSPLGATEPFVQHFIAGTDDLLFKYDAISERYNDSPPGVGKARFSSQAGDGGCSVWSTANGATPVIAIIIILSVLILLFVGLLAYMGMRKKKSKEAGESKVEDA